MGTTQMQGLNVYFYKILYVQVIFYPHAQSFEESNDDTIYIFPEHIIRVGLLQ